MNYVMHFDIAALFIMITVFIHSICKKNIQTMQTRMFQYLVAVGLLSVSVDLFTVYAYDWILTLPPIFNYLANMLYLISFNLLAPIYLCYVCLVVKTRSEFSLKWRLFIWLPIAVNIVLILTTIFTKWIFYFDENNVYCHGPVIPILYIVSCYYLLACMVMVIRYRQKFDIMQRIAVYFFTTTTIVAVLLQMLVFKEILFAEFAASISVLMVYLSLEDPNDYVDRRLGTYNRAALIKVLSTNIERSKHYDVLGVQLVGFKNINDLVGMKNGDTLLEQVVRVLKKAAGKDMLFIISGTRYAIVSEHSDNPFEKTIQIINDRFSQPFTVQKLELSLSALMCTINYPSDVKDVKNIMATLECSLSEFKKTGDNGVVQVSDEIMKRRLREHTLLQIMRHALHNGEFEMYYQPIYSVEEKRFTCAEALLRLNNNQLGYVSPEEFIPLAEKNGLILDIGEFVFRDVCKFISEQHVSELGIENIEINLSVIQCMQEKLHEQLISIIDEYGVPHSCIGLEITETSAVVSRETIATNMTNLIEQGVSFALDDYGSGFSNTNTIITYPFHVIKLDKYMVWSAFENTKALCALKYTVAMIKEMNMKIVAEGVETAEQAEELTRLGCDYFQGYYYSRPIPAKAFLDLLELAKI